MTTSTTPQPTRAATSYTDRTVYYVAHPVAPTDEEVAYQARYWIRTHRVTVTDAELTAITTKANVERALRWLRWLRRSFPESTFIMPWAVLAADTDGDPVQREAGLVDCEATAYVVGSIVMVGGRIGSGGRREMDAAHHVADLTWLGAEPPEVVTGASFVQWWSRQPAHPHLHVYAGGACVCGAVEQR